MKILHVGPFGPNIPGGLPPSILGFASAQAIVGAQVGLLSSLPLTDASSINRIPGVCLIGSPQKVHRNPWLISKDWILRIVKKFGSPDLVNFHSSYIPFNTALARRCKQSGWPYVITAHGVMGRSAVNVKRIKKLIANLLFFRSYVRDADAIHALTTREANEIRASFKVKKVIVVPNGIEESLFEAPGRLLPADLGDRTNLVLGFAGRIDMYHKGIDLLLNALNIYESRSGAHRCSLFLVGPFHTKKDERRFHLTVESLSLTKRVKVLGAKNGDEKLRYFLACDVFVHTSRFEGMPMAVLEAMALGRPCLVTTSTNVADIVCKGGGWKCEPDSKSIAQAIKSIYEQRDSLKALGQRSQELMRKQFTWKSVAGQLYKEHLKLCGHAEQA
ncbi:MAG: glycosyltransferase family 4 protein [Candidatus Hodarchaeota archaeon]